jgi:hypothetical protein
MEKQRRWLVNGLDIARLNEVIVIFTRFIKCVEGNFVSYFDTFLMSQIKVVKIEGYKGSDQISHTSEKFRIRKLS